MIVICDVAGGGWRCLCSTQVEVPGHEEADVAAEVGGQSWRSRRTGGGGGEWDGSRSTDPKYIGCRSHGAWYES